MPLANPTDIIRRNFPKKPPAIGWGAFFSNEYFERSDSLVFVSLEIVDGGKGESAAESAEMGALGWQS
ncbi:hypothetical protein [Hymenobacter sp. HDW8]|uniref:hypothetical protein n=1 Tax=Hymenobacter sp. HDW8 TaxID=2714932 RepID=UPI00140A6BA8|nr:hypothetical protein [Hymenobacter sp. HDW8]QIL76312.1 hypothetical protein G7064_10905 [Hymenobacter sp. HDW8]